MIDAHLTHPDQLQHGQKRHDDFGAAGGIGEQFGKLKARQVAEPDPNELDFFANGPSVLVDLARVSIALVEALDDNIDGVDQVKDRDARIRPERRLRSLKIGFRRETRIDLLLLLGAVQQSGGDILKFLVLNKLANQLPAGIALVLVFLVSHLLIDRQQLLALDVHERRGHDEKLTGDLQIKLAHEFDVFDEFLGDLGQIDLIDVHFLLANEVEQQIQRTLK